MSSPQWRVLMVSAWVVLTCITFVWIGSITPQSWLRLIVSGVIPPAMLLWFWNEDRPQLIGALHKNSR